MALKDNKRPLADRKVVQSSSSHHAGIDGGQYDSIVEYLRALLVAEARPQYSPGFDYLNPSGERNISSKETITDTGRCKMCEWCYSIVDHYDVDREVVSIAMSFLDRHSGILSKVSGGSSISNRDFQLSAVTSLFLAVKLHGDVSVGSDDRRVRFPIGMVSDLTNGTFSVGDIEASERSMLLALEWYTHPPTTIKFVRTMVELFPTSTSLGRHLVNPYALLELFEIARYLTELSACAGFLSINFEPSVIAFASILCAMDELDGDVLAIKYSVRNQFLANVKVATNLFPGMEDVEEVKEKLSIALSQSSTGGRSSPAGKKVLVSGMSPVCVVDGIKAEKKRRRVPYF